MTAVDVDRCLEGPPTPKWERAVWDAAPVWERLARAGVTEGDLVKLDPPIYLKRDREKLTTGTVDHVCSRVLRIYPTELYGRAWLDAVPPEQEELDLWAS